MARGTIDIDFPDDRNQSRHEEIIELLTNIKKLLEKKLTAEQDAGLIPQFTAIALLRTTFPTFKKWLSEYKIRPEKRGGRIFFKAEDIKRLMNGKK